LPNYWLVKTEPDAYSYADLERDGHTDWTGVRNYQARIFLRQMQPGDLVAVYHSVSEKAVVGLARVTKEAYPDPTSEDAQWVAVELAPERPLKRPVTLGEIKKAPGLENIGLIRQSRLSVMPLTADEFAALLSLAAE
jgi:predicted RNA-binding protein with PUA-like domain